MESKQFKHILFQAAFFTMACDGEVHKDEVAEIREMVAKMPCLKGFEYKLALKKCVDDVKSEGTNSLLKYLEEVKMASFSKEEDFQIMEIVIRMVDADKKINQDELLFMNRLVASLETSMEMLFEKYPIHYQKIKEFGTKAKEATFSFPQKDIDFSELNFMPVFFLY